MANDLRYVPAQYVLDWYEKHRGPDSIEFENLPFEYQSFHTLTASIDRMSSVRDEDVDTTNNNFLAINSSLEKSADGFKTVATAIVELHKAVSGHRHAIDEQSRIIERLCVQLDKADKRGREQENTIAMMRKRLHVA